MNYFYTGHTLLHLPLVFSYTSVTGCHESFLLTYTAITEAHEGVRGNKKSIIIFNIAIPGGEYWIRTNGPAKPVTI